MFKFSGDVEFKTILLIYKVLNDQTPSHHKECIVAYNTDRVICSQSACLVLVPRISKVEAVADPSAIRLLSCGASYLFVLRSIPSPSLPLSIVFHSLWFVFCHDHLRIRVPMHMCPLLAFSAVDGSVWAPFWHVSIRTSITFVGCGSDHTGQFLLMGIWPGLPLYRADKGITVNWTMYVNMDMTTVRVPSVTAGMVGVLEEWTQK